jgi:hypothetical protein
MSDQDEAKRQMKRRNRNVALLLAGMCLVFYLITITRT